jgi:hypothetical protein
MTDVWVCGECHSINRQRDNRCYKCGARQEAAATGELATHRQEQAIATRAVIGYRPAAPLGLAAAIFLLGLVAVCVATMIQSLEIGAFANGQVDLMKATHTVDRAAFAAFDEQDRILGLAQIAIIVPLLIFFGAWLSRVVSNVPALGGGIPTTQPWRAFVNTLLPIVNLRTVPGMIQDVLYRLDPKAGGVFMVATAWVGLVGSWLLAIVAGWYLRARLFADVFNAGSLDEALEGVRGVVTAAVVVDVVTCILISLGAFVLILLMIRIERRSRARDAEIRDLAGV